MEIRNIGVTTYKAVYNTEKIKVKTSEDGKKRSYFLNNSQETDKVLNEKKLDTIQLSDEALKIIEKKSKEAEKTREALIAMQTAEHNLEAADQQAEAMAKQAKNEAAMMKIMARISNGDKVPLEDERALMEYDSNMYQMAKMTAQIRENAKPHKYDSDLEDDETESENISEESMEYETASVEIEVAAETGESFDVSD